MFSICILFSKKKSVKYTIDFSYIFMLFTRVFNPNLWRHNPCVLHSGYESYNLPYHTRDANKYLGEQLQKDPIFTSLDCNCNNLIKESQVNSLSLSIPEKRNISMKSLLREKYQKFDGLLHFQQNFLKFYLQIVLRLNRFQFNPIKSATAKVDRKLHIDREIDLAEILAGLPNSRYVL